ncbi:tryptophan 7-halogenase [Actinacidiphila epipremni]|uniref:Tryptophan 7-halogenase n=1 Tax=Actinacidiphila epipremni TaxID=2053013 RepID=A0ABX0ZVV1_9ACTN|nr:tryptophan 7-halogenase [Actinacidiphila epipremni]NJP46797.1 tryptophan 7-halogenase [Actinacidiphila epipremni]
MPTPEHVPSTTTAGTAGSYDVVVAGGGPGGSTTAALVAMAGHRVLLLEKESFPRHQIGESLLPATIHGVCRFLGVTGELEKAGFMPKRGGTFRWGANPEPWNFLFAYSPLMSGPTSTAYQVERMKFDKILLDNARRVGVEVREQCTAVAALREGGQVAGLRWTDTDGRAHETRARYVVDASGSNSRLARTVADRHYSDFFRNVALYGYYEGGKRLPGPDAGNILCCAWDDGWFWYIPLTDTLTSVGAVVNRSQIGALSRDPEAAMARFVERAPMIKDYLKDAVRVTDGPYGRLRVRKDYSYAMERFWQPGMVLVGDAACFVDPVFSTGVHLATYGGLLAARSINSVLGGGLAEERAFGEFERRYRREYGVFYEFLLAFYDMQHNEESYFWQARKVSRAEATDLRAFVELIGGVSSGESALIDLDTLKERFGSSSKDLADAVTRTGPAQSESGERMGELFGTQVVTEVMQGMNEIQARASMGGVTTLEKPLFEGGLVASPDGLGWALPTPAGTGAEPQAGA